MVGAERVFDHSGLLYRGPAEYLRGVTAFVRSAVRNGDAVLVAVPGGNLELLRVALAGLGDKVKYADMSVEGRNPGRILPGVLLAFAVEQLAVEQLAGERFGEEPVAGERPGRRVSIVGEPVWVGRDDDEYPACVTHEALINVVFAERDAAVLCPYDAAGLDRARLRDAWLTHPAMITPGGRRPSPWYQDPYVTVASVNRPLSAVPWWAASRAYGRNVGLKEVRVFVASRARAGGLTAPRVTDLVAAVNELVVNTLRHTGGGGTVTLWTENDRVICQVDDHGYLADPLAGRILPPPEAENGRGLVLANHLCDLLRVHARDDGTSLRLYMRRGL
ncbi:sensor histidine kinase [Actinoplanes sp. NPDC051851]|uniref:sensor histidine kinase n=1 Tax=Actinoplanes sp. NPDC051851 TaxID=3154753 RepID=UPI0034461BFA